MRRFFLLLPLWLLATMAVAQNVKVDFNDGEYFFAEEDYEEALYAFGKVYKNGYQDNAYVNYRMGQCLLRIPGRKTESIPYLEKAVKNISPDTRKGKLGVETAPTDALLYLGNAYRINMEMDKAIARYNEFGTYIDPKDQLLKDYVDQQISSCANALVSTENPVDYKVGNLGQLNETHRFRYNMVVSNNLQTLAFMGKNPFYNGVYVSMKEGDVWGKPLNITPSIVSDGNMDVVGLSPDGKTMLLAVMDEFDGNIYYSVYKNNRWNPAKSLGKPINSKYFEADATFSPDGKSIYFSSNRKGSMGGMDIFRSDLQEDSTWSEPVNLGPAVNTKLNEENPCLSPDGKRLYFASQGHSTIGGFDVFYTELQEDGTWHEVPVNLGYPLNTTDDDFTMAPTGIAEEGTSFIFAQSKLPGFDLFKFEMIARDAVPVAVALTEPEEPEEVAAEVTPVPVVVVEPPPEKYLLRPVYFAFDKYDLTGSAREKLDDLVPLMQKYPSMELEITGHTDAVGTYEYNQRLSVKRATSVYNYLIGKGVSKERMKVTGMSESQPVARNRTRDNRDAPGGRLLNRRVEFKVNISGNVIIEMEQVEVPEDLKLDN